MLKKYNDNTEAKDDMPRVCAFCEKSISLTDGNQMLCTRSGVVSASYCCRKFRYDPLKRVPTSPPPVRPLEPDDVIGQA